MPIKTQIAIMSSQNILDSNLVSMLTQGLNDADATGLYEISVYDLDFITIDNAYEDFITKHPTGQRVIMINRSSNNILRLNQLTEGTDIFIYSLTATSPALAALRNGLSFGYDDRNFIEQWLMLLSGTCTKKIAVVYDKNFVFGRTLAKSLLDSKCIAAISGKKVSVFPYDGTSVKDMQRSVKELENWSKNKPTSVLFVGFDDQADVAINSATQKNLTWYLTDDNDKVGDIFGKQTVLALVPVPINYTDTYYNLYKKYREGWRFFSPVSYDSGHIMGYLLSKNISINKKTFSQLMGFVNESPAYVQTNSFDEITNTLKYSANDVIFTKQVIDVVPEAFYPYFQGDIVELSDSFSVFAKLSKVNWLGQSQLALQLVSWDSYVNDNYLVLQKANISTAKFFDNNNRRCCDIIFIGPRTKFLVATTTPIKCAIYPRYTYLKIPTQYPISLKTGVRQKCLNIDLNSIC